MSPRSPRRAPARPASCRASCALSRAGRSSRSSRSASTATGAAATVVRDLAWYPFWIAHEARSADVLHCTTMRGPLRSRLPVVVTVHDCALLRHPEAFPPWHRHTGRVALHHGARHADAVVAVSAFTRDELVELLEVPVERIPVVPNGVEPVFTPDGPAADR